MKNLSHITTEQKANFIICSYVCKDGSVIKEKYIGYTLTESKRQFFNKYKNL
jgi:hypothetical protein